MKFHRSQITNLMNKNEVRYDYVHGENTFRLHVSGAGVRILGPSPQLQKDTDLDVFAKALADAWKDYLRLKPQIITESKSV